ncbi:zinc ribbon domain-containing protein [candidate division WOR-3 bacterium]|nr:zinc ribbon domain-containing protein [candidate division WOR-3 bacterium]
MEEYVPMVSGIFIVYVIVILLAIGARVVFAVLSYKIGKSKGQETVGLLLGIFLGLIGLVIVAVLPDESAKTKHQYTSSSVPSSESSSGPGRALCKYCSREIRADARFCPYCGHQV